MASLSELFEQELTVQDVMIRLLHSLKEFGGRLYASGLQGEELDLLTHHYQRVLERNEKC